MPLAERSKRRRWPWAVLARTPRGYPATSRGRENSLPVLWALLAPISYGKALIREGKPAEGRALLEAGLAIWEASGGKARIPLMKAFLAAAMALTGALDNALHLIDQAFDQIERPRMGGAPSLR
jgi:hypothetical protein